MSPVFVQLLNSVARTAVVWICARFGANITDSDATRIVVEFVAPAAMLAWSIWQKYKAQQKLNSALATSQPMSEHQLDAEIAQGSAASALGSKHDVPQQVMP